MVKVASLASVARLPRWLNKIVTVRIVIHLILYNNYTVSNHNTGAWNWLRQMYSEWKAGTYVENNAERYDVVVYTMADYYYALNLSMVEILWSHTIPESSVSHVYTSPCYNWGGYTNGFYFGPPGAVAKILTRWKVHNQNLFPSSRSNYESTVWHAFSHYKINHIDASMWFWKIRWTGESKPWIRGQKHNHNLKLLESCVSNIKRKVSASTSLHLSRVMQCEK